MQIENTNWVRETDDGIQVLCFDSWSWQGKGEWEIDEVWTVDVPEEYIAVIFDEIDSGYRKFGQAGVTQDLLADFDSEHYDIGTPEFDAYLAETEEGKWAPEVEWLNANYRNR